MCERIIESIPKTFQMKALKEPSGVWGVVAVLSEFPSIRGK